jgi:ABC-type branched-subunit amino acid transport system substrate-binding protein
MTVRRSLLASIVLLTVIIAGIESAGTPSGTPSRPHFDAKKHAVAYSGPGREDPEPEDLQEVLIGYFGPNDPAHPEGGDLWLAANLAVDEANRAGGHQGLPIRLVPAWSENPWGTGVAELARIVYSDRVWAVLGSIDGASTHLAEQVVAKARLTLITPASSDKTVNLANVAWMFSCLPADDRQAHAIGQALIARTGDTSFVLISATDHDSRLATEELSNWLGDRGRAPLYHLEFAPGSPSTADVADRVASSGSDVAVIMAGPLDSARLLAVLRSRRTDLQILGSYAMSRRIFLETAGPAAEGVVFPLPCDPSVFSSGFVRLFEASHGRQADCVSAQAYDAARLLIGAIEAAGLNRARIRDAVRSRSPWSGVAGTIEWTPLGQNQRKVTLATIREGQIVALP